MIPRRYLIATLFIAAMLVILAVVQARRSNPAGGGLRSDPSIAMVMGAFETLAQFELQEGWVPRYNGTRDPDQPEPWPPSGGFNTPWEPASPYLLDQGLALNGPGGTSEVVLWRGLEWRHYRFDAPLCSARLDPDKGRYLLVTLNLGSSRFETRLLEVPEGRVLWASDSGSWSRFSWDGRAVVLGLEAEGALLLATRPVDLAHVETTLAPWDERRLPPPPKGWITRAEMLWPDAQDLPGQKLLIPWSAEGRFWFTAQDRLWAWGGSEWALWGMEQGIWRRLEAGRGILAAHPPEAMGLVTLDGTGEPARFLSPCDEASWEQVPAEAAPWPSYDPAWAWREGGALDAWDGRGGEILADIAPERQRDTLAKSFKPAWRIASGLRASVLRWLPYGPEVALRESRAVAWVWVGNRILLVRLRPVERLRAVRSLLKRQ